MSEVERHPPQLPFIRRLCTHLSEEELLEAEASFWRTIEIVRRIHERTKREEEAGTGFDKP